MLRNLVLVVFSVLLSSCATSSSSCTVPVVAGEDAVTVIVYRPSASYGMLYAPPFTVDNCPVGKLANNSSMKFSLSPGEHRLAAEKRAFVAGGDAEIEASFEAGETYYLRYSMSPDEFTPMPGIGILTSTSTHLFQTTKEDALKLMPALSR